MAITQDAFGNTFAGNFASGDAWEPNTLLTTLRTALGSNDRANINRLDLSNFRIDWRPNITDETRTGVIPSPSSKAIESGAYTLAANSRFGFSFYDASDGNAHSAIMLISNTIDRADNNISSPTFPNDSIYWAVATDSSISFFVSSSPTNYSFISIGVLKDSDFSFPDNTYGLHLYQYNITTGKQVQGNGINGSLVVPIKTFSSVANYPHTKESDVSATTSEVELYLRRETDNFPLGYVPNVFKVKVDGSDPSITIGDTVRLNLVNATVYYTGQGNIFCKVVGRLGNTSENDMTGDYLFMRIAS